MESNLITSCFKVICLLVIVSFFYNCSQTTTTQLSNKNYKMDMSIVCKEFNIDTVGMAVFPSHPTKNNYVIELESDGRMDLFTLKSCSREISIEDARKGFNRKKVVINYSPNLVELTEGVCPIELRAFEEAGRHSRGYIDIQDDQTTLPYLNVCGEKTEKVSGVGVCQGKISLMEKVIFDSIVSVEIYEGCDNIKSENGTLTGKEFSYQMQNGFCVYVFYDGKNKKLGRLTTYAYEEILVRR